MTTTQARTLAATCALALVALSALAYLVAVLVAAVRR